jgi:hypothetical protein
MHDEEIVYSLLRRTGSHCNERETECAQLAGEETNGGPEAV